MARSERGEEDGVDDVDGAEASLHVGRDDAGGGARGVDLHAASAAGKDVKTLTQHCVVQGRGGGAQTRVWAPKTVHTPYTA